MFFDFYSHFVPPISNCDMKSGKIFSNSSSFRSLTFLILFLSVFDFNAQSPSIDFLEYNLKNGLKVILHENHKTPIVAVSVMYHVGAKNENPERTGFAHFFEHLLFEGSKNIKIVRFYFFVNWD